MIHVRLDGMQLPQNEGLLTRNEPYTRSDLISNQSPVTVGVAEVELWLSNSSINQFFYLRNTSTAGQIIGLGPTGLTIATARLLVYPGETTPIHFDHSCSMFAIADAAAGRLHYWCRETDPN